MWRKITIRCAHCKGTHGSVGEVKDCARGIKPCMSITEHERHTNPVTGLTCPGYKPQPRPTMTAPTVPTTPMTGLASPGWRLKGVSKDQRTLVANLGGDVSYTYGMNRGQCSDYINELKAGTATVTNNPFSAPNRSTTIIPMDFLKAVPNGYYASRPDSNHEYTFFRVSRPKSDSRNQYAGCIKIQTQHGPELRLFMVIWPGGNLTVYNKVPEEDFLLVTVDPNGCGLAYARKLQRCALCGTELTDARSRWYGIGPDCEKKKSRAADIVRIVEETKGAFRFGADED